MPANLPPQYYEAEKRYRLAKGTEERIEALEAMLSIMPKHKGTDKLRAELRTKIAKLSAESERKLATSRRGGGYYIRKEGAGQVVLVGLPNVGKSRLVSAVTNAAPEVADYPFTTQLPTPGMMSYENIQVQLIDLPPLTDSGAQSWLRGILKRADALLLVVDLGDNPLNQVKTIIEELDKLKIKPVGRGAETDGKKAMIIGSKNDLENSTENYKMLALECSGEFPLTSTSAKEGTGLEELKKGIYDMLDIIRVYTKAPGEKANLSEPVVLKRGSTVKDAAESVHKDFVAKLKYTLLWGSGKYSGQQVKRDHILEDGDVIELHIS